MTYGSWWIRPIFFPFSFFSSFSLSFPPPLPLAALPAASVALLAASEALPAASETFRVTSEALWGSPICLWAPPSSLWGLPRQTERKTDRRTEKRPEEQTDGQNGQPDGMTDTFKDFLNKVHKANDASSCWSYCIMTWLIDSFYLVENIHFPCFGRKRDVPTYGPMDQPMDRPMDWRMDRPNYSNASTHLKIRFSLFFNKSMMDWPLQTVAAAKAAADQKAVSWKWGKGKRKQKRCNYCILSGKLTKQMSSDRHQIQLEEGEEKTFPFLAIFVCFFDIFYFVYTFVYLDLLL